MVGVAIGVAAPFVARAQTTTYYPTPMGEVRSAGPPSGYGIDFALGGGVTNFTGASARGVSSPGGQWNARLTLGTRLPVGLEASYLGSAQDLTAAGLDERAYLLGNGAEAALRLALPIARDQWLVSPFAIAGFGWTHYSLQRTSFNASDILGSDDVYSIPLGAGLSGTFYGVTADARFTYRPTFSDEMLGGRDMSNWAVTGNLGYEF
jgi:hypothetical protein